QLRASSLTQPRAGAAAGSQENRGILFSALALSAPVMVAASVSRSHRRSARTRAAPLTIVAATAAGGVEVATGPQLEVPEELNDIGLAGVDIDTPHWSVKPMEAPKEAVAVGKLDWANLHSLACVASGVLFLGELVRFVMGIPPSDAEVYFGAVVYAIIYSSRFEGIKMLPSHFRVTFYATTGWTVYYIAHMLAATNPVIFFPLVYPAGVVFLASTVYFYKHWLERMYRHFVEDRFRPYYVPGLMGLMYFHGLDTVDLFNQWIDPQYWEHVPLRLPDQAIGHWAPATPPHGILHYMTWAMEHGTFNATFSGIDAPGPAMSVLCAWLGEVLNCTVSEPEHATACEHFKPSQRKLQFHPSPLFCIHDDMRKYWRPLITKVLADMRKAGGLKQMRYAFYRMELAQSMGHGFSEIVETFEVSPPLPLGLELAPSTGVISGILQQGVTLDEATYLVTARNAAGEVQTELVFSVAETPPTSLSYPSATSELVTGEAVSWEPELQGGGALAWSVRPDLPKGLELMASSGTISGIPFEAVESGLYEVAASNAGGKAVSSLRLQVKLAPPGAPVYRVPAEGLVVEVSEHLELKPEATSSGTLFSVS
ncbi:unnamed protein product, partial [Polarella glacialis]